LTRSGLPDGVTVAQQTLNLFVMVQIHVGQPIFLDRINKIIRIFFRAV
jgi:hypothetical protein